MFKVFRAVVIGLVLVSGLNYAQAAPIAIAESPEISVILHNDPCLTPRKEQYPYKAQVIEPQKHFETCYVVLPQGLVILDYDDMTDIAIPVGAFRPVNII